MTIPTLDRQLLDRLSEFSEIELSGFSAREGLTGSGVTVLKGRTYFGSWRVTGGCLIWNYASAHAQNHYEDTVEGAVRHTLLLILKNLEIHRDAKIAALAS